MYHDRDAACRSQQGGCSGACNSIYAAATSVAQLHTAPGDPDWAVCSITASSERVSTVCVQGSHTITIDHPTYLGGHDSAAGPVAHFLGSLVGAQQASLHAGDGCVTQSSVPGSDRLFIAHAWDVYTISPPQSMSPTNGVDAAVAKEQGMQLGKVTWEARARIDARGVHGDSGVPAGFDR